MYNTKSDRFSPKIKLYIYGNRKSNANETNGEIIMKMEAFDRLNFFQNYRQQYTVILITTVRVP